MSARSDRGSSLIMAIVFVTVVGMVIAGALSYSAVSLNATARHYVPARDRLYTADAAAKAAIAYVLAHPAEGRSEADGGCKEVRTYGEVDGEPVTVQICPQGSDSLTTKGGGSSWGLQTLATGSEVGLDVSGAAGLQVNGNVSANSSIAIGKQGSLVVNGGVVKARGGCSGTVIVDGVVLPSCTVATAPAADPGYTTGLAAAPAAAVGSCNNSTKIADLGPGTWTSATLTAAIGSCDYIWMEPGIHYLDSVSWTVKGRVVAGALTGNIKTSAFGEACQRGGSPTKGAMLVFGGTSTLTLSGSAGTVEVCGLSVSQPSLGRSVQLPVFGLTSDVGTTESDTLATTEDPEGKNWANSEYARTIDGAVATYRLAKKKTSTPLVFREVKGSKAIPAAVTTLTADLTGLTTATTTFTLTVLNANGATACTGPSGSLPTSSLSVVSVNLTCSRALVAPLTVQFVATASNSGKTRTVSVDGLVLRYTAAGATMSAQSGCVVAPGGCDVISSSGNKNQLWLDGEVYLPRAKVSLQVPNLSSAFSTLGVVVRVLAVKTTGSTAAVPIVAVDNGALNPGDVTVTADIGEATWMECRVEFGVSGPAISSTTVRSCTASR